MKKRFRSPWDLKLIIMTTVILLVLVSLASVSSGHWVAILLWTIILGTSALGVYGYSIQDGKLKILRLGWAKEIELSSITDIENKPNAMLGSVRTFGIGGLFGYIGKFRNSILGSYTAYATHTKKTVSIESDGVTYIVTPDTPEEFVKSIKEEL